MTPLARAGRAAKPHAQLACALCAFVGFALTPASALAPTNSAAIMAKRAALAEADADGDGLSDFQELHKYLSDPSRADTDGDGVPDGDWDERREHTYTVRALMHVMAPFDVATMNDDYQDVRVLACSDDLLEFEVVVYPFNTVADAIVRSNERRASSARLVEYVAPGTCCDYDDAYRARVRADLAKEGIEIDALDDATLARTVARWLFDRSSFDDGFTIYAAQFDANPNVDLGCARPRLSAHQARDVEAELARCARTLEQQWSRELYGKSMYEQRVHGSCTSSAIYASTALKALGLPTRTIVCVPILDASDERELGWIDTCLSHVGVRAILRAAASAHGAGWTSHTFNEVFVGGRWTRLNYARLGQNVLDREYLGLMVHVHTFADHALSGLSRWGDRRAHPRHAELFGGENPYSCIALSDRFGVHVTTPNEPFDALREARVERVIWYGDASRDQRLSTRLEGEAADYLVVHLRTDPELGTGKRYVQLFHELDASFVLRASGEPDVRARGVKKYWFDAEHELNDFLVRVEPADRARVRDEREYELVWTGRDEGVRCVFGDGAGRVARRKPDVVEARR